VVEGAGPAELVAPEEREVVVGYRVKLGMHPGDTASDAAACQHPGEHIRGALGVGVTFSFGGEVEER